MINFRHEKRDTTCWSTTLTHFQVHYANFCFHKQKELMGSVKRNLEFNFPTVYVTGRYLGHKDVYVECIILPAHGVIQSPWNMAESIISSPRVHTGTGKSTWALRIWLGLILFPSDHRGLLRQALSLFDPLTRLSWIQRPPHLVSSLKY